MSAHGDPTRFPRHSQGVEPLYGGQEYQRRWKGEPRGAIPATIDVHNALRSAGIEAPIGIAAVVRIHLEEAGWLPKPPKNPYRHCPHCGPRLPHDSFRPHDAGCPIQATFPPDPEPHDQDACLACSAYIISTPFEEW